MEWEGGVRFVLERRKIRVANELSRLEAVDSMIDEQLRAVIHDQGIGRRIRITVANRSLYALVGPRSLMPSREKESEQCHLGKQCNCRTISLFVFLNNTYGQLHFTNRHLFSSRGGEDVPNCGS